jgi:xanthine dehydrogenase YagT iron-sulfur-binding subunit
MKLKKPRRRSILNKGNGDSETVVASFKANDSKVSNLQKRKVSRRTFLKASSAATVVGVSVIALGQSSLASTGIEPRPSVPSVSQSIPADPFASQTVTFNINGTSYTVLVEPRDTLAIVLREQLGLIGTKLACNRMECGACTVLINDVPHESCQYLALWAAGANILTTEGGLLAQAPGSKVAADPVVVALQNAWLQEDGGQCCYCSPGQIMSATALLKTNSNPSVDDIKSALAGNLCRCGNYPNIIASVQLAAQTLGGA